MTPALPSLSALLLTLLMSPLPAVAGEGATLPTIDLAPHGADWRVGYRFAEPVSELRFSRTDAQGNRMQDWRAVDDGIEIVMLDGEEVVRRRDGAAFEQVGFDIAPLYRSLEKDYAPFSPFGDGGLLIHSGRFHACAGSCEDAVDPVWQFSITLPDGAHLIHGGKVIASREPGSIAFDDSGSGTNLYVGRTEPVQTDDVVAVIDAQFPAAARTQLDALFPRLMGLYAAELGALADKPMLFASNDAAHPGGGYGYQGGTLPGQVFVHLYGRHEAFGDAEFAERMNWFFAHEAAHLYQRYEQAADPGDAWMHEGGADAMAVLALQRLGLATPEAVDARLQAAIAECAPGIAVQALHESHRVGAFRNFYACGMVMQIAVDAAARRASDGRCDLFCVWRAFHARVDAGEKWGQAAFIAAVEQHAGAATAGFLRDVAGQPQPEGEAMLRAGLREAGVDGIGTVAP